MQAANVFLFGRQIVRGRRGGHWPSAEGGITVGSHSDEQHPFGGLSCPYGAIHLLLAPTIFDGSHWVGVGAAIGRPLGVTVFDGSHWAAGNFVDMPSARYFCRWQNRYNSASQNFDMI